jgi:rod shape-determining protein MreC
MAVSRRTARPRFTLVVLILASLTLITLDVRGGGTIPSVRGRARDLFSPIQSAVSSATRPITDFFQGVFEYQQLKDDNVRLRGQIAALRAGQIEDQDDQQTVKDLTDLLKLSYAPDIPTVAARVVAGAESNFQLTMVIDRGTAAGILKGMPVVAGSGLVGRVVATSADQSTVLLLTDASASVGIRFDPPAGPGAAQGPPPAYGVASGQGSGRPLSVTLANPDAAVAVRAVAVTSGLSGSPYPAGIPVGTVTSSVPEAGVKAQEITVTPVVDLSRLGYVDVLIWTAQDPGNMAGADPSVGGVRGPGAAGPPTTLPAAGSPGASSTIPGSSGSSASAGSSSTPSSGSSSGSPPPAPATSVPVSSPVTSPPPTAAPPSSPGSAPPPSSTTVAPASGP